MANTTTNTRIVCHNCHSEEVEQIALDQYKCKYCGTVFYDYDSSRVEAKLKQEELRMQEKQMEHESAQLDKQLAQDRYHTEYEDRKKELLQKAKTRMILILAGIAAVLALVIFFATRPGKNEARIPLSSDEIVGRSYEMVVSELNDAGFSNITLQDIDDLNPGQLESSNLVTEVSLNGSSNFKGRTYFDKESIIRITYHSVQKLSADEVFVPASSSDFIGMSYSSVQSELESNGFTNITTTPLEDLQFDQTEGVNEVSAISINSVSSFEQYSVFKKDSPVTITYHSNPLEAQINVSKSSDEFYTMNYQQVISTLESDGFLDITPVLVEDLVYSSEFPVDGVSDVSIGTKQTFNENEAFSNYAKVVVTYHQKKPLTTIHIPFSSKEVKGNYTDIQRRLEEAGFTEVKTMPVGKGLLDKENNIESITINGNSTWEDEAAFKSNANITIKYYVDNSASDQQPDSVEAADGWIQISESAKSYKGQDYSIVKRSLVDAGFTNITCEPNHDLDTDKDVGKVEIISIAGNKTFDKDTRFAPDAPVFIQYHDMTLVEEGNVRVPSASKTYEGKFYGDVASEMRNLGFTDVTTVAAEDLINGVVSKENTVKQISINGISSFKEFSQFPKDSPIVITYHSFKPEPDSAKSKLEEAGEKLQDTLDGIPNPFKKD